MRAVGQRAALLATLLATLLAAFGFAGCGLTAPDIREPWDSDIPEDAKGPRIPATAQIEFEVKKHVFCELGAAVKEVNKNPVILGSKVVPYALPPDWIAQLTLSFQVDESSALSPGVTLNTVLPNAVNVFGPGTAGTVTTPQSRAVGLGGTLSSTATRIDKFNPVYSIDYLMIPNGPGSVCNKERPENDPFRQRGREPAASSPLIIGGDLGIRDWLFGAILTNVFIPSQKAVRGARVTKRAGSGGTGGAGSAGGGGVKPDTLSYEIKFVIVSSGNVTPTWKLVNISANASSTLFSAGRTRTHDLIITIGPDDTGTLFSHLSSEIGQAVSGANGARMSPTP
jgi:hypothetical protein